MIVPAFITGFMLGGFIATILICIIKSGDTTHQSNQNQRRTPQ